MNSMKKKYLPVGSVVKIKQNTREVMIVGYRVQFENKEYDYCAVLHPYGVIDTKKIVFNQNDIEKVSFTGFINDDFTKLQDKLLESKKEEMNN